MTRRTWLAPATFAIVVLAGATAALLSSGRSPDVRSEVHAADLSDGWARPANLDAVSLSDAQSEVSYKVTRPQDELASDSSIEAAYLDSSGGVRLDYTSGVIVINAPWPEGKDPVKSYEQQWTESGGLGTLQTINGHAAWIVPGDAKATTEVPGGGTSGILDPSMNVVELTVGNIDVVIAGKQPVSDLVRVAQSIT